MAIQITPKGNRLFSGRLTAHEESLLNARLNAGPKTIAQAPCKTYQTTKHPTQSYI